MRVLISKKLKDIADRIISIGDKRMDKFHEHKKTVLDKDILDRIRKEYIGESHGIKFYYVDGKFIRDHVDDDFCLAGNPGRYKYVPMGEIWADRMHDLGDQAPDMIHEYREMKKMIDEGWDYDRAHEYARKIERTVRLKIKTPSKNPLDDFNKYIDENPSE
jgi:hypothetical protein